MRSTPSAARGGYATVLAMLLLSIGITFSAWLFTAVTNNTAMTRNEKVASRSLAAADSSLAFGLHNLREAAKSGQFRRGDPLEQTVEQLRVALEQRASGGLMPGSVTAVTAGLKVGAVNYGPYSDSMAFEVTPSQLPGRTGLSLLATGVAGVAGTPVSRTVCVEVDPSVLSGSSSMDYAIASRGTMHLASAANSGAFKWDAQWGATTELGTPVNLGEDGAGPSVLLFSGVNKPEVVPIFPAKYLDESVYTQLDALAAEHKLKPYSGGTITNVMVTKDTTFANCELNGIVYVRWPFSITFGGNVKLNAMIVYERPTGIMRKDPVVKFDKQTTVKNDIAAAKLMIRNLFDNSAEADTFIEGLQNWAIHAPDATMELEQGNFTGKLELYGNYHVATIAASGIGSAKKDAIVFYGQILCEKDIKITGNHKFSIMPPGDDDNPDFDRRLKLSIGNGAYWEKY